MLDTQIPEPASGRTFRARRRIRLSDIDASGRLRLDAVARFLQDVAMDDVQETGWGVPEHVWVVRRIRVDVLAPFVADEDVALTTWCSGLAAIAAGRRWSLTGNAGGRIEVDSVWIHLDAHGRPTRIEDFGVYAEATGGRRVSTRLELPDPSLDGGRVPWPLRVTDVDRHGHVNNAVYWQAVEQVLATTDIDPRRPLRAELDYRSPIDLGQPVDLLGIEEEGSIVLGFVCSTAVKAVARLTPLAPSVNP